KSKDPRVYTILFEDSAALLGLIIAFVGITAARILDMPELDGVASIGIAFILGATSLFLVRESKGLLMGEPASKATQKRLLAIAEADRDVVTAHGIVTVHLGPDEIVAGLFIEFADEATAPVIEACIE